MKKIYKYCLVCIISIGLAFGSFIVKPKALDFKTGYGTFTQGSYNWIYGETDALFQYYGATVLTVHIELQYKYSGTMIVTMNGISNFADGGYVVIGGQINTTSLNQIQIKLNYDDVIDIYFVSTTVYNPNASVSVSVSFSGTPTNYYNEDYYLRSINTTISSLSSTVTTINSRMQSILNYIGSGTYNINQLLTDINDNILGLSDYLYDSDNDVSWLSELYEQATLISGDTLDIYTETTFVNDNLEDICDILTDIFDFIEQASGVDLSNIESDMSTIVTSLATLHTDLNNLNNTINNSPHPNFSIPRWQLPAYYWFNTVCSTSALNNWQYSDRSGFLYRPTMSGDGQYTPARSFAYDCDDNDGVGRTFIVAWVSTGAFTRDTVKVYFENVYDENATTVYWHLATSGSSQYNSNYYYNYLEFVGHDTAYTAGHCRAEIEFTTSINSSPLYFGYLDNMPNDVYVQLGLKVPNQTVNVIYDDSSIITLLESIDDGINGLLSSDPNISITIGDNVTNFNYDITRIQNIENTYIQTFNSNIDDIVFPSLPEIILEGVSPFNSMVDSLFNGIPIFKLIIILILVAFVFLSILGV